MGAEAVREMAEARGEEHAGNTGAGENEAGNDGQMLGIGGELCDVDREDRLDEADGKMH